MEAFTPNAPTTSRFGDTKSFTILQMEAALCAWEWMLENNHIPLLKDHFSGLGSSAMRHCSMQAGDIALRVHEHMEAKGYGFQNAYDWEFVPEVLRRLDWDKLTTDNQYGGEPYVVDIHAIFCAMVAADKASSADPQQRDFYRTRTPDQYIAECRVEAERMWGYSDLVSDHPEAVTNAMEASEDPATFIQWLGEKYELTPREVYA